MTPENKVCKTCGVSKSLTEYGQYTDARSNIIRRRNSCKSCRVIAVSSVYKARLDVREKASINARKSHLKNRYGLTEEQFINMKNKQQSKCAICNQFNESLNIDHCHKTGKIRALLCWNCNTALGKFQDNSDILHRALEYLKEHI